MIKQLHKLMLLAVAALFAMDGHAVSYVYDYADVVIDSIYYDLDKTNKTAKVRNHYLKILDGRYVIYYSASYSGDVIIPRTIYRDNVTYTVTSIENHAFDGCTGLTSITIPSSVTSIGDCAFYGCI